MTIEYRVRPVTRYIVTRFEAGENCGSSSQHGEFDNPEVAYQVGYALCKAEHDRLGYLPGDERIRYPEDPRLLGVQRGVVGALSTGLGGQADSFPLSGITAARQQTGR